MAAKKKRVHVIEGINIQISPISITIGDEFSDTSTKTANFDTVYHLTAHNKLDFEKKAKALLEAIYFGDDPMAHRFSLYVGIARNPVKPTFMRTDDLNLK